MVLSQDRYGHDLDLPRATASRLNLKAYSGDSNFFFFFFRSLFSLIVVNCEWSHQYFSTISTILYHLTYMCVVCVVCVFVCVCVVVIRLTTEGIRIVSHVEHCIGEAILPTSYEPSISRC